MASKDLNTVSIVGRLTKNSEYRIANNGTPVANFSIAVNRRKKNGDMWEDEVNFFDVVFMGRGAERISMYLEKGRQIAIQGELHQRRWEGETGPRSSVEIWAQDIQLLAQSSSSQNAPNPGYSNQYSQGQGSYPNGTGFSGPKGYNSEGDYQNAPSSYSQRMPQRDFSQNDMMQQDRENMPPSAPRDNDKDLPGPEAFEGEDYPF